MLKTSPNGCGTIGFTYGVSVGADLETEHLGCRDLLLTLADYPLVSMLLQKILESVTRALF